MSREAQARMEQVTDLRGVVEASGKTQAGMKYYVSEQTDRINSRLTETLKHETDLAEQLTEVHAILETQGKAQAAVASKEALAFEVKMLKDWVTTRHQEFS